MRSFSASLVKYILLGFNVIFAISGLCVMIIGAIVLVNVNEFKHFVATQSMTSAIILIIIGLIIITIAVWSCWFAIYKESSTLLFLYAVLLGIIFIIVLAVGVAACFYKSDLDMLLTETLENSMRQSQPDDVIAWNSMQQSLSCCGIDNPSDWRRLSLNKTLPASCCRPEFITTYWQHCSHSLPLGKDKYFQEGCLTKLKRYIDKYTVLLVQIGLGMSFIQLLGIILALYLAIQITSTNNS